MSRFSTVPFERPLAEDEDFDEGRRAGDHSAQQTRTRLGIAWLSGTVAGILALGYSMLSQSSRLVTTLGLIGILGAYAVYGYTLRKKNPLQFADSLYYMGFLWALFALIATFIVWPPPKLTAEAVLTTFGYALATTFCGMLLRLLVVQFQDTIPDRLVHAQDSIDRRVSALIQQIDEATMEISAFRDRAAGDLGATLRELVRSLAEVRDEIAEQHRTMATTMSAGFESSLNDILGRLAAIRIPQDMLTAEVAKLVAALGKRQEDVEEAVHRLERSLTQAADTVTQFGDSLCGSDAAKGIATAIQELSGTVKGRTEQLARMTMVLDGSRAELDAQLDSLQSIRSGFAKLATQLTSLEAELTDLSSQSISAHVRDGLLNVQKAIQSSLDASKTIESTMRGVMFFLKERVTEERSGDGK